MFNDTGQVGEVTQAVYSPRLERNIGFALPEVTHSGELRVESAEGVRDLSITSLPFFDPDKKIPRAPLRKTWIHHRGKIDGLFSTDMQPLVLLVKAAIDWVIVVWSECQGW